MHSDVVQLKDTKNIFDGHLGNCWSKYVDSHQEIAKDYYLLRDKKVQYLHNILSKNALRFYLDAVRSYVTTYQQAVAMIDREYN